MSETERTYRRWLDTDLRSFEVRIDESDLLISLSPEALAKGDVSHRDLAKRALASVRADLESYLRRDPGFAPALQPYDPLPDAPAIAHEMAAAARACGVGPMAAVAGAVAQHVGEALLAETPQVIVENGGDIFLYTSRPRTAAIFAGSSPLSGRLGLCISRTGQGIGLCTSSGTVGPSLSFGRADAAIVLAGSAALADAAATALGNRIQTEADIAPALDHLQTIPGLLGGAVIIGEHLGAWGEVELVRAAAAS
jgi:hypothetical protein